MDENLAFELGPITTPFDSWAINRSFVWALPGEDLWVPTPYLVHANFDSARGQGKSIGSASIEVRRDLR